MKSRLRWLNEKPPAVVVVVVVEEEEEEEEEGREEGGIGVLSGCCMWRVYSEQRYACGRWARGGGPRRGMLYLYSMILGAPPAQPPSTTLSPLAQLPLHLLQ
jgi:hypothetical protein